MKSGTQRRAAAASAAALFALAVLGYTVHRLGSGDAYVVGTGTPAAVSVPKPVAAAPTPVARRLPVVPHDAVAPAAPTAFEIKGPAFDIKARVCRMPYIRPLDPPGDQRHTVCWVRDSFGVAPGSRSGGTSYVLGHAWAEAPLVLNRFSEFAMAQVDQRHPAMELGVPTFPVRRLDGYTIVLKTPHGVLTYVVTRAFAVPKDRAADVGSLMANTPNRIVLITCGVKNGADIDVNVVAYAYLHSSLATHRTPAQPTRGTNG